MANQPTKDNRAAIREPNAAVSPRSIVWMIIAISTIALSAGVLLITDPMSALGVTAFVALFISLFTMSRYTALLYLQSKKVLHFEDTIGAITDIYWQWDLKTGAFEYSGKMAELLGYEDRKPTDGFWKEIIHPVDRPLQKYQLLRHLADETVPYYCEYRFLDCNQEYQWFAGRGKVVSRDTDNQPILMVGSIEHIQPRKDMEQSLIHAHKMEALGQLTGGIAHDFNNILGTVLGYAELSLDSGSPSKMQEYAGHIHAAGSRARNVVRQLLDFSRNSTGDETTVDLVDEVNTALVMVRSTLPSAIQIEEKLPDTPCYTTLDPNQLQRVLLNLCINARDAMENRGVLGLELRTEHTTGLCASCQQEYAGHYQVLTVSDTGAGLDTYLQSRMFEPFFTTKAFGEGTGMGLSVVHGIIHECGGHITIESQPGTGTSFSLYLPVATSVEPELANVAQG